VRERERERERERKRSKETGKKERKPCWFFLTKAQKIQSLSSLYPTSITPFLQP